MQNELISNPKPYQIQTRENAEDYHCLLLVSKSAVLKCV